MALARHTGCPNPQGGRSQLEAVLRHDRGGSYRNLLKWKDLPIAEAYVEEKVKEALAGTYNKLISAGPAVADRLLSIALNPETKSYAAVSACEAVIRSIERGVLDREMREHITKRREQMAQLEHGRPIDV